MAYLSNVWGNILLHQSDTRCHTGKPTVKRGFSVWQQHYQKFKWFLVIAVNYYNTLNNRIKMEPLLY
uniref:Uncharacterized protein n=1 Tax=Anopheles minimus TaxID=112268 RepID=A0A182WPS1_9DIPT